MRTHMRVRELYNQLAHDLKAHGDCSAILEYKSPDGNIHRYRFIGDRYVDAQSGECGTYVLRIGDPYESSGDHV